MYSEIRVDWIRTIFVLATIFTAGLFLIVYLVMAFVLPVVPTQEAWTALQNLVGESSVRPHWSFRRGMRPLGSWIPAGRSETLTSRQAGTGVEVLDGGYDHNGFLTCADGVFPPH